MPSLREHQGQFARAILRDPNYLPSDLTAKAHEQTTRRFAVYRNNVVVSLVEALCGKFPAARRIVGDDFFRAMARIYVAAHPPRSPLLMFYGSDLADFAAAFPPAQSVPYLGDVIRLEALRVEAYHAADVEPADPAILSTLGERAVEDLRFVLHPSLRLLRSAHPVVTLWRLNQPATQPAPIDAWHGENALVSRPDGIVLVDTCDDGQAAFIEGCLAGHSFGEAAEAAFAADPEFNPGAAIAALFTARLVAAIA